MSQQNGGFPGEGQGSQPSATPHVFPFGAQQSPEQQAGQDQQPWQGGFGSGPQYSAPAHGGTPAQQWGAPTTAQPQQPEAPWSPAAQQHPEPQYGTAQQAGGWPHETQAAAQWPPQGGQQYGGQPQSPAQGQTPPQGQPPVQGASQGGQQQFSGILDPHTGEIHPVPDLQGLDETDALLVVVSGPDAGAQILLDTDVVTVGRSPNADIFLDDVTVSRKHAEFVRTPSGFTLRDTGSLNGTYVGRQLIDSIELQNGADVQIGKFRMIFQQRPRTS
ncbi:FHA domain-containing protein [Brevibacterium album]|uniref:FHA domain-containing protein n=1 Tax=Brevibacterium album TaxID=417948 RepID=UPI000424E4CC